jgi:hypothetical protein
MALGEFYKLEFQQHFVFFYIYSPTEEKKPAANSALKKDVFPSFGL